METNSSANTAIGMMVTLAARLRTSSLYKLASDRIEHLCLESSTIQDVIAGTLCECSSRDIPAYKILNRKAMSAAAQYKHAVKCRPASYSSYSGVVPGQ